jgi:hypothetical protein
MTLVVDAYVGRHQKPPNELFIHGQIRFDRPFLGRNLGNPVQTGCAMAPTAGAYRIGRACCSSSTSIASRPCLVIRSAIGPPSSSRRQIGSEPAARTFKRNDQLLEALPIGIIVFPGSGISPRTSPIRPARWAFRCGASRRTAPHRRPRHMRIGRCPRGDRDRNGSPLFDHSAMP